MERGTFKRPRITIQDAELLFLNFEGRPTKFNVLGGKRSFGVYLSEEMFAALQDSGWNVKRRKPGDPEDVEDEVSALGRPWLPIAVGYEFNPPMITQIAPMPDGTQIRTKINEELVGSLDRANILGVDLTFTGSHWDNPDSNGPEIKAWLLTMYITIDMDELDRKYAVIPEEIAAS